jgi:hypothetical protein
MNWKSTAAFSGVTLVATWLGWTPARPPALTESPALSSDVPAGHAVDIQEQAARLQTRVRGELEYRDPKRNPFRFIAPQVPSARPSNELASVSPPLAIPEVVPFTLSGMATESVDGQPQRTAILTMAADVLFAKQGETVGTYTVTRIDESGVELTAADGTVRRLTLIP